MEKQEKKKKLTGVLETMFIQNMHEDDIGRAKKRQIYNRRFVNVVAGFGKRKVRPRILLSSLLYI